MIQVKLCYKVSTTAMNLYSTEDKMRQLVCRMSHSIVKETCIFATELGINPAFDEGPESIATKNEKRIKQTAKKNGQK